MTNALQAEIDAAMAYEELFVQSLFHRWTTPVLEAARIQPGDTVLDVACGTGVLARNALVIVGANGVVSGLDPSAGMLEVARKTEPKIQWHLGGAETLPFDNASQDAVVSQFGLMFFQDRDRALREMCRVLKPGGRLVVVVWDSVENIPPYASTVALLDRVVGTHAGDALRAPFVLGNRTELAKLFADADVPVQNIDTQIQQASFPNLRSLIEAELRGWLPIMGVELSEQHIAKILDEAHEALGSFVTGDGAFEFPTSAHLVIASKTQ